MSFQQYCDSLKPKAHIDGIKSPFIIGICCTGIVVLLICCFTFYNAFGSTELEISKSSDEIGSTDEPTANAVNEDEDKSPEKICVHVGGCVVNPGMYEIDSPARIAQAIDAAGGLTEDASIDSINLASSVEDGQQIIVKSIDEISKGDVASASGNGDISNSTGDSTSGKVNINTANATELQTVSGIGPAKAKKIIDYRTSNGPFKSIDDLTKISGIGEKTLESLKDSLCV